MTAFIRIAAAAIVLAATAFAGAAEGATIAESIENTNRADANTERDGARKPADMLAFIALESGDVVLDYGSSGGYWSELFSSNVGDEGKIYAHHNAGDRFDSNKEALTTQYEPFGNVELLPVARGTPFPLEDDSVDTVLVSYLYHHMHYAEDSGEIFPASSAALFSEFSRVLKPGGTVIVIEHAAVDGSTRAQSAGWHRTPPETAKADITGVGFELADEAPDLYMNPEDDLMNIWFDTGLSGKTTTFVHKYRKPE
jgi:predicted methyltransferase